MDWFKNKLQNLGSTSNDNEALSALDRLELEKEFLQKTEYNDIDFFHLKGYECWAKVVKVYDGDTITVVFFLNGKPFKFKIRLSGIDTAEKKSDDQMEVEWANRAISRLNSLIGDDGLVYVKCRKWDKYGRLLAEIYDGPDVQESFNRILLKEGLAYVYSGKARRNFREWAPWDSWLDNPDYEAPEDAKPIDNIQDSEVINQESTETEKDFQEETNVAKVEVVHHI